MRRLTIGIVLSSAICLLASGARASFLLAQSVSLPAQAMGGATVGQSRW